MVKNFPGKNIMRQVLTLSPSTFVSELKNKL